MRAFVESSSPFRVALVHAAAELEQISGTPSIIIFPEGVDDEEIRKASVIHPEAVVVGAVKVFNKWMMGFACHKGQSHIKYFKVESDHRGSKGVHCIDQHPIAHFPGFTIAILICMDVDNVKFRNRVLDALRASTQPAKILCIPADMTHNGWFRGESIDAPFHGVYVALCNQPEGPNDVRTKSFIADTDGKKIPPSVDWPIYIDLLVTSP